MFNVKLFDLEILGFLPIVLTYLQLVYYCIVVAYSYDFLGCLTPLVAFSVWFSNLFLVNLSPYSFDF